MSPDERDFHVEEFRQLKAEMSALLGRITSLVKYGLISSAAIYSWFLTHMANSHLEKIPVVLFGASLIPPVLVFFFGLLAIVTYQQVITMGTYLKEVELALGDKENLGWESYLTGRVPKDKNLRIKDSLLLKILFGFYVVLLIVEIGIAIWVDTKF